MTQILKPTDATEKVARAIWGEWRVLESGRKIGPAWPDASEFQKEETRKVARAAIAAMPSRDPDELREALEEVARLKLIVQAYVDPADVRADLLPLVTAINEEPFTALSRNVGDAP